MSKFTGVGANELVLQSYESNRISSISAIQITLTKYTLAVDKWERHMVSTRGAMSTYFSKQSIRRLEPIIHDVLSGAQERLDEHAKSSAPVKIKPFYGAITGDIISTYYFGTMEMYTNRLDLNEPFFGIWGKTVKDYNFMSYFHG